MSRRFHWFFALLLSGSLIPVSVWAQDFDFDLGGDEEEEETSDSSDEFGFDFGSEDESEEEPEEDLGEEPSDESAEDILSDAIGEETVPDVVEEVDADPNFQAVPFPNVGKSAGDTAVLELDGLLYHFRWCPAGTFQMGSNKTELGRDMNEFQHEVTLTNGYWMLACEVTLDMFTQFVAETGYKTEAEKDGIGGYKVNLETGHVEGPSPEYNWRYVGFQLRGDMPVTNVSWNDATAFATWLNGKMSTSSNVKKSKRRVALPTEAQWEYACRAGSKTAYCMGENPESLVYYGNVRDMRLSKRLHTLLGMERVPWALENEDSYLYLAPVSMFQPNQWGIYDMHGNVWEWCADRFGEYQSSVTDDPSGDLKNPLRVLRGGGWDTSFAFVRSAVRGTFLPSRRFVSLGFRVMIQSTEKVAPVPSSEDVPESSPSSDNPFVGDDDDTTSEEESEYTLFGDDEDSESGEDDEEEESAEEEEEPGDAFGFSLEDEEEPEEEESDESDDDDDFDF